MADVTTYTVTRACGCTHEVSLQNKRFSMRTQQELLGRFEDSDCPRCIEAAHPQVRSNAA